MKLYTFIGINIQNHNIKDIDRFIKDSRGIFRNRTHFFEVAAMEYIKNKKGGV